MSGRTLNEIFAKIMAEDDYQGRTTRVARDRDPSDACQRSTPGCCIDHDADESCETW